MKIYFQNQASECALACLAMILSAYGSRCDLHDLRRQFSLASNGAKLQQLISWAATLGFSSRPVKLQLYDLPELKIPCILHWDLNHFVVLKAVDNKKVTVLDPAVGERRLTFAEVSLHFTGVALEFTPNAAFKPKATPPRVAVRSLMGRVFGLRRSLTQVFGLAAALELFALTAPLFSQLVVDDAIATQDHDLLTVLVIGFGLLLIVQTAIGLARSWLVMVLSQTLSLQWASNVFAHLIKLPTEWFEKRHLGDVVSRFGAVGAIQKTLTTSVVEALLDGIMSLAALVLMLLYSPLLTSIVVGASVLYGLLRWAAYHPFRDAAAERLVIAARENSHFLETLRAITPLKLYGREQERRARWQNLVVEVQNRDVRTAKMSIAFSTTNTFLFGAENLLVMWLGAGLVMQAALPGNPPFTIGMLFAFIAYKTQFSGRISALINYAVEIKMLSLHAERLADIALTAPEVDTQAPNELTHLEPRLELRGVSFRYGEGEPWILRNANLVVAAGESVAVVGPSGGGKTTLLKLMLGLLQPSEGDVLYGGVPVRQLGLGNVRRQIGTVMQEDVLLSGSIADNIAFFDLSTDMARIEACARLAAIHNDITRMPMGYQTLVGDLGSSLSGGQKQRVLVARALYKDPKVLALDEATSHLDVSNERHITQALSQMRLTRLIVAHRPETIAGAQRVVQLRDGQVFDVLRAAAQPSVTDLANAECSAL